MLRVVLGIVGVALIVLGVFGGAVLENVQLAINEFFEPDTVVVQAEPEQIVVAQSQAEQAPVATGQSESRVEVAAAELTRGSEAPGSVTLEDLTPENVTEVHASSTQLPLVKTSIANDEVSMVTVGDRQLPKQAQVDQIVKATTGSDTKNALFVLRDKVNLREGPSIDHAVVLQLKMGQELMEFKRDGKWVHVGAYGTSGKIGWVHGTLVGNNKTTIEE